MTKKLNQEQQLNKHVVMLRNFMKTSNYIDNIDSGRTAYIQGFYEWKNHFNKSKSTFYRMIKSLKEVDKNFWYCKTAKLLFYYAT